jgi:hypothetical protein
MASVNMSGCRSFIMNHIQDEIRAGGDVSHILNVIVGNEKDRGVVRRIKAAVFKRIANKPITKLIEGYNVTLKWKTKGRPSSACYFCYSNFNDIFVNKHTRILLSDIVKEIDAEFQHRFTNRDTGLALLVCNATLDRYPDPRQFDEDYVPRQLQNEDQVPHQNQDENKDEEDKDEDTDDEDEDEGEE